MAQQLLTKVTEALDDKKGQHIEVIDVSGKCSFADHIVIVTGSSNRHVKSLAMEVSMVLSCPFPPKHNKRAITIT